MKKLLFLIFLVPVLFSQNYILAQKDIGIDDDKLLIKLKEVLPAGWILIKYKDLLEIQRNEPAYILFENRINAPVSTETREQLNERIKKYGKEETPRFIFDCSPKLDKEKILSIKII